MNYDVPETKAKRDAKLRHHNGMFCPGTTLVTMFGVKPTLQDQVKVTLCYLNNTMWDERTYRLLLFADALFNAGRLHHDARQTLLQEENSTDVQLMTFYIKLKICKSALSGCRADFKMLSASCSVSFQSSSTWRSENKYKLVGFSKPGHYAV